jgi:DNA polymerase III delta prime subunit
MHHAHLLIGSYDWASKHIKELQESAQVDTRVFRYERMSIADVRAFIYEAGLRPVEKTYRTLILQSDSLLHEAQNALLKVFEDPNPNTQFYVILPRKDMLLPTLASRFNLLAIEDIDTDASSFSQFLEASYADRLLEIPKRLDAEDTRWVESILTGIEKYSEKKQDVELMKAVLKTTSYIRSSGSSKKMLLEHLALTLSK